MSIISKLLGKSPFEPLHQHMLKVKECVDLIRPLVDSLVKEEDEKVEEYAKKIAYAEHEADLVKKEVRNNLPKGLFLPVARGDILRFLKEQDNIADSAEDFAVLITLRKTKLPDELKDDLKEFVDEVLETFNMAVKVSNEINILAETSFGGVEAEKVVDLIENLKTKEWEADKAQMKTCRKMFSLEGKMDPISVIMWMHIFKELGNLANHSENAGDQIRIMLHNSKK